MNVESVTLRLQSTGRKTVHLVVKNRQKVFTSEKYVDTNVDVCD